MARQLDNNFEGRRPQSDLSTLQVKFGVTSTPEGQHLLRLAKQLQSAENPDEASRLITEWLASTDNPHLELGAKTFLAALKGADEKVMAEWRELLDRDDPRLNEKAWYRLKEVTLREQIALLSPAPITRTAGHLLSLTPDASVNALTEALADIQGDLDSAKRFLGALCFPFGYIKKAAWEEHLNSPIPEEQRQMLAAEINGLQEELNRLSLAVLK